MAPHLAGPSVLAASPICSLRLRLGPRPLIRGARTACRRSLWRSVGGWGLPGVGAGRPGRGSPGPEPLLLLLQHPLLASEGTCFREPVLGGPAAHLRWCSPWARPPAGPRHPRVLVPGCSQVRTARCSSRLQSVNGCVDGSGQVRKYEVLSFLHMEQGWCPQHSRLRPPWGQESRARGTDVPTAPTSGPEGPPAAGQEAGGIGRPRWALLHEAGPECRPRRPDQVGKGFVSGSCELAAH